MNKEELLLESILYDLWIDKMIELDQLENE
jgi:hypothetical protein